jgi:hypothetical protein
MEDLDCDDGNSCTADSRNTTTGECANATIADRCASDSECDDEDECTTDICSVATTECRFEPIDGCGEPDAGAPDALIRQAMSERIAGEAVTQHARSA